MAYQIDITRQNVIIARLRDFCRWSSAVSGYETDPWGYMRGKLIELEQPVSKLKQDQLMAAADAFITRLKLGQLQDADIVEFKTAVNSYLPAGDFVDISFNLTREALSNPGQRETALKMIQGMKAVSLFQEERKPEGQRSAQSKKLVGELHQRLGMDLFDKVLSRKPKTQRRKRMVLRRIRRAVAEYCSVLHLPFDTNDTFSPFMLLRVEALLVACLRVLNKYR